MNPSVIRIAYEKGHSEPPESLVEKEWLVTNGLGGYASGTLAGVITRGFHGYLIAALPTPLGRILMLNDLLEKVELEDGQTVQLSGEERVNSRLRLDGFEFLESFCLEDGNPVWIFRLGNVVLEKRILMVHRQNTVHVTYQIRKGPGAKLTLRPSVNFRPHEAAVNTPIARNYAFTVIEDSFEISSQTNIPPLRLMLYANQKSLTMDRTQIQEILYRIEESRGYAARGDLWSPGFFSVLVSPNEPVTFVASVESWETIRSVPPHYALSAERIRRKQLLARANVPAGHPAAELVLAADQFIIVPEGRNDDMRRARAAGDDVRTVIAGYPWFTDWGRDTMIALEGLTLTPCRYQEAGYILRTFAYYVRDGLIPNMFPEGHDQGLYHTADATLWFFHAISRYVSASGDQLFLTQVLPTLNSIINAHLRGTLFGIKVDENDGLLTQGQESYQLTWMDAKVGDWVVTPRRGKAVEINALWYNALCHMRDWFFQEGDQASAEEFAGHASRAYESFNRRFWCEKGYLFDVIDGEIGDDSSFRPNQILALSLDFPILIEERWEQVLQKVREKLLTPVGLRTLAPDENDFKPKYDGNLKSRDAAYHQGTVWPWLMGPFLDAWLRVYPDKIQEAESMLGAFQERLSEYSVGSIAEIFDAEAPYKARGCIAQAWSVSEILRSFVKLETLKQSVSSEKQVGYPH